MKLSRSSWKPNKKKSAVKVSYRRREGWGAKKREGEQAGQSGLEKGMQGE